MDLPQHRGLPLQVEHVLARSKGGTDRPSNLTLARTSSNDSKATPGGGLVQVALREHEGETLQSRFSLVPASTAGRRKREHVCCQLVASWCSRFLR